MYTPGWENTGGALRQVAIFGEENLPESPSILYRNLFLFRMDGEPFLSVVFKSTFLWHSVSATLHIYIALCGIMVTALD